MIRDGGGGAANNRPFAGPKKKRGSVIQPMMMNSSGFGAAAAAAAAAGVPALAGGGGAGAAGESVPFNNRSTSPKRVSIRMEQQQMQQLPPQQTALISLEDVQNLELILDNFISQFNWISSEIDDLLDQLVNAEGKW